jgi:hypothetical protein
MLDLNTDMALVTKYVPLLKIASGDQHAPSDTHLDAALEDEVSPEEEKSMLATMRSMYMRMLRAEYWELIQSGFLPQGSHAPVVLLTSVDFAEDHVADRKICDLAGSFIH